AIVDLIAERTAVTPGETFYVAFDMKLDEGWHVYWRNPGDAGLPPRVMWDGNGQDVSGDFVWPIPKELEVAPGQIMDYGYDDRLVLPFPVTVPSGVSGPLTLSGVLDYLICKDICIPEEARFTLTLAAGAVSGIDETNGALIGEWVSRAPTEFSGEACLTEDGDTWRLSAATTEIASGGRSLRFFPYRNEISHSAKQPATFGQAGGSVSLTPAFSADMPGSISGVLVHEGQDGVRRGFAVTASACSAALAGTSGAAPVGAGRINLFAIAGLALLGGLILNLMPCVLPVLSMKAIGMVEAATHGDAGVLRVHGWLYTAGVVLSFLAVAAAFLALRAAGEFLSLGFQLQYPVVVAGLAVLVFVIGLWLLGAVEFGSSIQGAGSDLAARRGGAGAFFTGVLAAIVGAPCIGPFLGVALGAVLTQPAYIVIAVFALVGLGLALPFLMLSHLPGLSNWLPKPGLWMVRLKQAFAFPMFLTAVWLLSVLDRQTGGTAVTWVLAGMVLIAFAAWGFRSAGGALRRGFQGVAVSLAVAGLVLPI
ncbi:MAG: protein-disulfide reductase DsbD domain-containing protein, partial [Pseudomonadota bacterium]